MKNVIAIDVGSGFTKIVTRLEIEGTHHFPSIVTPFPEKAGFGMNDEDYISFDGHKFLTDKTAQNFGHPAKRFDTTTDDWHGQSHWFALLYKAIAISFKPEDINGQTLHLVTGLPQKVFSEHVERLMGALKKEHTFDFGYRHYTFMVEPIIIPQAAAALIYNGYNDESLLNGAVGVIDIGTFTTGLSVMDNAVPVEHRCGGISRGMTNVYDYMAGQLRNELAYSVDVVKMPEILNNQYIMLKGERVDVSKWVAESIGLVSEQIVKKIHDTWGNAYDLAIFLSGGGAKLFYDTLKKHYPHLKMSKEDAFFEVAKGMFAYQQLRLSDSE